MKNRIHSLIFISSLALLNASCGESAFEKTARERKEALVKQKAELNIPTFDIKSARAEMNFCQSNREKIIKESKILKDESKSPAESEDFLKCFYWLYDDPEFLAATRSGQAKRDQAKLNETPKDRHEERLFILRSILYSDPSLKTVYATELERLEQFEQLNINKREKSIATAKRKEGVLIGMTKEDVLMSQWGKPVRINRTITSHGISEQWIYNGGYLYFDGDILTAIQN